MSKVKDKERLLPAAREKQSYLQRSSHKTVSWFLKRNFAGKKGLTRGIQNDKNQGPITKIILSSKAIIYNRRADKVFPRQGKAKGSHHHYIEAITLIVKGTYLRKRRRLKLWTLKWQQTHNYQQVDLKTKTINKLSKPPEQEQNHRYGGNLEGYQLGEGRGRKGERRWWWKSIIGSAGVPQWIECQPVNPRVQFPVRAHSWVACQFPSRGCMWEATTHWCFTPTLSPSLPLCLKINKYNIF